MQSRSVLTVVCLVATCTARAAALAPPAADAPVPVLLPAEQRQAIIHSIAESWRASQRDDGFLPYGYDFLADKATDEPGTQGYIVRQAGAFFGWAEYYRNTRDARDAEPIRRGLDALARLSVPVGKSPAQSWVEATHVLSTPVFRWKLHATLDRLGLLYDPQGGGRLVSGARTYETAWTGATALALLAELAYSAASGDERYAAVRRQWMEGLLALRVPGAGFRELPTTLDSSEFYDGEAWLALARYADRQRDDRRVTETLEDLDTVLMREYTEHPAFGFYHWGAMAAAQRWRTTGDPRFVQYLKTQANLFFPRFRKSLDADANTCGPMEGMAATLGVLLDARDPDGALIERVRAFLASEGAKIPRLQIPPAATRLPLAGRAEFSSPALAGWGNALLWGVYEPKTRVDAAQHCLSALLQLRD